METFTLTPFSVLMIMLLLIYLLIALYSNLIIFWFKAPCGTNAECQGTGSRAVCKCLDGYEGDPFVRYIA